MSADAPDTTNLHLFLSSFGLEHLEAKFILMGCEQGDPGMLATSDSSDLISLGLTSAQAVDFKAKASLCDLTSDLDTVGEASLNPSERWTRLTMPGCGLHYLYNSQLKERKWPCMRASFTASMSRQDPTHGNGSPVHSPIHSRHNTPRHSLKQTPKHSPRTSTNLLSQEIAEALQEEAGTVNTGGDHGGHQTDANTPNTAEARAVEAHGGCNGIRDVGASDHDIPGDHVGDGADDTGKEHTVEDKHKRAVENQVGQKANETQGNAQGSSLSPMIKVGMAASLERIQMWKTLAADEGAFEASLADVLVNYKRLFEPTMTVDTPLAARVPGLLPLLQQAAQLHGALHVGLHNALEDLEALEAGTGEGKLIDLLETFLQAACEDHLVFLREAMPLYLALGKPSQLHKRLFSFMKEAESIPMSHPVQQRHASPDDEPYYLSGLLMAPTDRLLEMTRLLIQMRDTSFGVDLTRLIDTDLTEKIDKKIIEGRRVDTLDSLAYQVTNIPDDWSLSDGRELLKEDTVTFLYDERGQSSDLPPAKHPHKDKRGESVNIYLFHDVLLITTPRLKYRYRIHLTEVGLIKRFTSVLLLVPEMLVEAMPSTDAEVEALPSGVHALMFGCEQDRDHWTQDLQAARDSFVDKKTAAEAQAALLRCPSRTEQLQDLATGRELCSRITVSLRVRPFVLDEEKKLNKVCIKLRETTAILNQKTLDSKRRDRIAVYDHLFGPKASQKDVYHVLGEEIMGAISAGFNAAVMAYGNTGAGKTYTFFGSELTSMKLQKRTMGLVPRLLTHLFEHIEGGKYCYAKVNVSFLQVYNNQIQDLQSTEKKLKVITIRQAGKKFELKGLKSTVCTSPRAAMEIFVEGNKRRAVRKHSMNGESSRSHTVIMLNLDTIATKDKAAVGKRGSIARSKEGLISKQCIYLVDLAGSENVAITKVGGFGTQEAREINKSLITLGRVIHAISDNTRRTKGKQLAVPFRESKLTHLLAPVFTNNKFVCSLVLNVSCSPALSQAQQTGKTMVFGQGLKDFGAQAKLPHDKKKKKSKK